MYHNSFSFSTSRNIKSLSDVQITQVACGYWHSHALSKGKRSNLNHEVILSCTFIIDSLLFIFSIYLTLFFMSSRPSLFLGSESIWTAGAWNGQARPSHTPTRAVFTGHSLFPGHGRRRSQLCPNPVGSSVRLGPQQVRTTGPQR